MVEKVHGALKKCGGTLEDWFEKTITYRSGKPSHTIIVGKIHGDDRWEDGVVIFTSKVVNVFETQAETMNTFYKLGKKHESPPCGKTMAWRYRDWVIPPTSDPYEVNDTGELDW